jgi:hypothetical protein
MIRKLRDGEFSLVLAGHIHRQDNLVLVDSGIQNGPIYMKSVSDADATTAKLPLFVNTTSAGPRGHLYRSKNSTLHADSGYTEVVVSNTGQIQSVEAKDTTSPVKPKPAITSEALREAMRAF